MTNELSASDRYRAQQASREAEIVDVTLPSGFVIKMVKPSKFVLLFRYGRMPQTAANGAVKSWIDQGILKPGEISEDAQKEIEYGMQIRDRVLELSHSPKLVVGDAINDNELSTDFLTDEDATYLFAWVQAGGELSASLGKFPRGRKSNVMASANSKGVRHKT